ncbi:multidrug ABC transporter ATPase [Thermosipho melanesiensis]|uniref:ABC-type multidrug transport system ATPase and permease components-like protein n=2 Tax=Thermosipho melanesiensis TaxID=46541 RepID=A6LNJ2_THEM4|nr:ABC transporter ATP-binding protein [Thermosipho melanesiensis]ABR31493.1 ABC-type multidrug transport system ATPase and permease components-like protein [Thermosipho melanesiensis BI429]APT74550.1 multidrug ABC transporter ATPase [Thermosipho melanesiensis]OOC36500.1 multidrug ABC transporter ATPase [Thermosipho melanesiensis]OOC37318.1 multidrug ABC transporter ATPase [Thermosipho melanesiensis]OOC38071.1 multidrug ABC transporter ATPase [Thermosipho melanesiensis]
MKNFYKYFFIYHRLLPKSFRTKKFFIDLTYTLATILSFVIPFLLGKLIDSFGNSGKTLQIFLIFVLIYLSNFVLQQIEGYFRIIFSISSAPKFLIERSIENILKKGDINIIPEKEMDKIFSFKHIFEFFYNRFSIFVFLLPFLMAFSILILLFFNWKIGIIATFGILITWISANKKVKIEEKVSKQMNESEYKTAETLSDVYSGYEELKSYETVPFTFNWIKDTYNYLVKSYDSFGKVELRFGVTYELLAILTTPLLIVFLSLEVYFGKITPGIALMLFSFAEKLSSFSQVYIHDTDYISWVISRAKVAYNDYLREGK